MPQRQEFLEQGARSHRLSGSVSGPKPFPSFQLSAIIYRLSKKASHQTKKNDSLVRDNLPSKPQWQLMAVLALD